MSHTSATGTTRPVPPAVDRQPGVPQPVSPVVALGRHWVVGLLLVVVGTGAGVAAGASLQPTYTAESRVAVGSNDLSALAVPGYAFGAQELAASTARYLDNSQALGALEPVLGDTADQVVEVTSSPIPDSNIVRLEVSATDEDTAVLATRTLTDYLVEQAARVNSSSDADEVLARYGDLSRRVAAATAAREAAATAATDAPAGTPAGQAAQDALVEASAQVDVLTAQQTSVETEYQEATSSDDLSYQLVPVSEASPSYDTATSLLQRYGLIGFVLGVLAALLVAVLLERRRARVAASTGAPVVSTVRDGPTSVEAGPPEAGPHDRA